jgi:putative peptide zinc metalloprotease protein
VALFSPHWYRVENLRPQIRSHVRFDRHFYRGERWYVLEDPASGRHHRFSPTAYHMVSLMDGERTVSQIWEASMTQLGDDAPDQGETIMLLAQLHAADVMRCDVTPDSVELLERFTKNQRRTRVARYLNPSFARFPLFDPDAMLEAALPWVRPLFGRASFAIWCVVMLSALLAAGSHWDALTSVALSSVLDPANLVILFLSYPLVKALHELGHAFATKVWGGEVHEMGVMLLVFMPMPYVDASAASSFADKRKRMVVGASGVMVELFLSAIALFIWLNVAPGILRSVAWNVMMIGGVSTLFFNGNPLLRFDGYYVLADWIEAPNLSSRANQYIAYLFQHYVLGLPERRALAIAPGERGWFVVYGILSFVYRPMITLGIALFLASRFFFLGVMLAVWSILLQLVLPAARSLWRLRHDPRVRERPERVGGTCAGLAVAAALLLFVAPIPIWTVSEGVVWLPEHAQVRAEAEGFVVRVLAEPDADVVTGQPLIETVDPLKDAEVKVLAAKLRGVEAEYAKERLTDLVKSEKLMEEIDAARHALARAREEQASATIRAPGPGRFVLPEAQDLPGSFVRRGDVLGYVADLASPTVRTVVSQADIERVGDDTRSVSVRLAERMGEAIPAQTTRLVPAASDQLPSMALGAGGGGGVAVDSRDEKGLTATEHFFQIDLALPQGAPIAGIGGRVFVRFEHGAEPLFQRSYRSLRRLFMGQLGV